MVARRTNDVSHTVSSPILKRGVNDRRRRMSERRDRVEHGRSRTRASRACRDRARCETADRALCRRVVRHLPEPAAKPRLPIGHGFAVSARPAFVVDGARAREQPRSVRGLMSISRSSVVATASPMKQMKSTSALRSGSAGDTGRARIRHDSGAFDGRRCALVERDVARGSDPTNVGVGSLPRGPRPLLCAPTRPVRSTFCVCVWLFAAAWG
jgi:hypothetical protein